MIATRSLADAVRGSRRSKAPTRKPRRFIPAVGAGLEGRLMMSVAPSPGGMLPAEVVGSSTDRPIPGPKDGSTHEITVGPDGAFWITQMEQGRVVRMTLDGAFSFFPMGEGSMPHGAEFDADGHLWVGLEGYGSLVEMDTHGNILGSHTIPYSDTQGYSDVVDNHGLEVARNGKVWFTGKESNVVGNYDPATGQFRIFPLPMPDPSDYPDGNLPIYIDEAPDGSMYFTNLDTSSVGRLFPETGEIVSYELPGAFGTPGNARPIRVVLRDDGVATVSEESGSAYAFITPDGVVTEYPLSPSGAEGASLTYDRAGQLWVQYNTPDAIARVNPDGSVTPFTIPTLDATQHRVTVGPDGALWFTELATDKVGRMVTGHENGPRVDRVLDQRFRAGRGGVDYQAAFQQNRATFRARTRQMLQGRGNEADRRLALSRFSWNLQGAVNQFATANGAPATFGVKLPTIEGPTIRSRFQVRGGNLVFTQVERIGAAVYSQSFSMRIQHGPWSGSDYSSLSSATANYLEALKVLSNDV